MIFTLCDSRMSAGMRRGIIPVFYHSATIKESSNTMIPSTVACHGRFADELAKSAAMVYGEAERVHTVTFMPDEGPDDLLRKHEEFVAAGDSPEAEAVLLLVDLSGSSPYNAVVRLLSAHESMDVLSGVNLPMPLELLDCRAGCPASSHMETPLLHIDNHLIHDQAVSSQAKVVKCDAIFAISSEAANNELRSRPRLRICNRKGIP